MLRPHRGRLPVVDPTAYVDASAQVIGDVQIGADSSIWMNASFAATSTASASASARNVQDGTVVHVMHDTHPTASATT